MKRGFALTGATVILIFGLVLHFSYILSGGTVWSILISSVNSSAWETLKPFAISYIMWIVIELSCIRPSLLHFICSKIIVLYFLAFLVMIYCLLIQKLVDNTLISRIIFWSGIYIILIFVQLLSYRIYKSEVRIELFYVPILLSLFLFCVMILFFSLYPPHITPFYDFKNFLYGVSNYTIK